VLFILRALKELFEISNNKVYYIHSVTE